MENELRWPLRLLFSILSPPLAVGGFLIVVGEALLGFGLAHLGFRRPGLWSQIPFSFSLSQQGLSWRFRQRFSWSLDHSYLPACARLLGKNGRFDSGTFANGYSSEVEI